MSDDLSAPLGQGKKRRKLTIPPVVQPAVAGILGACLLTFVLWAILANDPLGGESVVVVSTADLTASKPDAKGEPNVAPEPIKPEPAGADKAADTAKAPVAGDTQTVTIIDGSSGKSQQVQVPATPGARSVAVDPKLLESTRHGQIPRVGLDGARALTAYAQAAVPSAKTNLPKIAVVVGGLGIGAASTSEAMAKLPAAVTFAFAPYGTDLSRLGARARSEGHELLLQLPMEPFDYPDNDPGPQTLLTGLSPEQNVDRMHWLMSRMQGYVGVANYMGARFTATESSLAPVLRETARRGLLFLDDGASPRSLAGQIAGANSLPFVKAHVMLDAVPTGVEIDRALVRLEAVARENGSAVGIASALPVSIERLAQWSKTIDSRGFVLVPISAIVAKVKSAS